MVYKKVQMFSWLRQCTWGYYINSIFCNLHVLFFIVFNIVWPLPTLHTLILKEIDVTINNCSMKINICWTEGYTYPYVTNLQHLFKINFLSKQNIHFFFYTCKLANHICLVLRLQRKIWSFWKHMYVYYECNEHWAIIMNSKV